MTQREIDAAKATLPSRSKIKWQEWSNEQRTLHEELSCREMINSCLTYEGIDAFWRVCEWRWGDKSYADPYIRTLGLDRVKEIAAEQEKDFRKAKVILDVYIDSEGCAYNSVIWGDE